ncbi:MAG TPA: hypothetical protein VHI54_04435 [Actinomycetota bacterium]|nr:hypothetical protein [Actinomycetota bacterium]
MASVGSGKSGRATREFTVSALFGWTDRRAIVGANRPLFLLNTSLNRTKRVVISARSFTGSTSRPRPRAQA